MSIRQTMEDMIYLYKHRRSDVSEIEIAAYTAAIIKHYELLYEMLWKFLKVLLLEKYGTDATGSKDIFRACFAQSLVTGSELDILIDTVRQRNLTAHVYDQAVAKEVCTIIINSFDTLSAIIEKIT